MLSEIIFYIIHPAIAFHPVLIIQQQVSSIILDLHIFEALSLLFSTFIPWWLKARVKPNNSGDYIYINNLEGGLELPFSKQYGRGILIEQ